MRESNFVCRLELEVSEGFFEEKTFYSTSEGRVGRNQKESHINSGEGQLMSRAGGRKAG